MVPQRNDTFLTNYFEFWLKCFNCPFHCQTEVLLAQRERKNGPFLVHGVFHLLFKLQASFSCLSVQLCHLGECSFQDTGGQPQRRNDLVNKMEEMR